MLKYKSTWWQHCPNQSVVTEGIHDGSEMRLWAGLRVI